MGLRIMPTLCSEEKKNIFGWRENQRLNVTFVYILLLSSEIKVHSSAGSPKDFDRFP